MNNIYFTSDTHYNHGNIASGNGSKWDKGFRHYSSVDEMNKDIVTGINKTVKVDDTLYHLGDWSFGGIESIYEFWKQLNCKNIHLVLGNHDTHIEANKVLPNCHLSNQIIIDGPPNLLSQTVEARDLFKSVNQTLNIQVGKTKFFLSHYAHRVWLGHHKGFIHLYGHSHDSLDKKGPPEWGKSMDVGIDSAIRILGEARPFYLGEIKQVMSKREIYFPDHHNMTTNI